MYSALVGYMQTVFKIFHNNVKCIIIDVAMDDPKYFENIHELFTKLNEAFPEIEPQDLRDTLFFLDQFRRETPIPLDTEIYVTSMPLVGMEVISEERVSDVLVGGVKKFESLNYSKKSIPPLVVIKGGFRQVILHGELYAIEAHGRNLPIKSIVFDVGERDPFEAFKLKPNLAVFLTSIMERGKEEKQG